jgi:hypothetical protein
MTRRSRQEEIMGKTTLLPPDGATVITTRVSKVWLGEDGIYRTVTDSNAQMSLEDSQEQVRAYRELGGGERLPLLVDIREIKGMDRQARKYMSGAEATAVIAAAALFVHDSLSRMIGNFFLGINKSTHPARLFADEAEALAWLQEHKGAA